MPHAQRSLGQTQVSAQGFGCMGLNAQYSSFGGYDDTESLRVLTRAADLGYPSILRRPSVSNPSLRAHG